MIRSFIRETLLEYHNDIASLSPEKRMMRLLKRLVQQTNDVQEIVDYVGKYYGHLFYDFGPEKIKRMAQSLIGG